MSAPFDPDILADLHDRLILRIDYHAAARRLTLRIETRAPDEDGGPLVRTLAFDNVFGLHCEPADALAPLDEDEDGEILRFDVRERAEAPEFTLVYLRGGAGPDRPTKVAMFRAFGARWLG